jgi:hypothetical protein
MLTVSIDVLVQRCGTMKPSLERRARCLERIRAAQCRTHYLWQDMDETDDQVEARIRAMIASGEASPNDRFVTFCWRSPEGDAG